MSAKNMLAIEGQLRENSAMRKQMSEATQRRIAKIQDYGPLYEFYVNLHCHNGRYYDIFVNAADAESAGLKAAGYALAAGLKTVAYRVDDDKWEVGSSLDGLGIPVNNLELVRTRESIANTHYLIYGEFPMA